MTRCPMIAQESHAIARANAAEWQRPRTASAQKRPGEFAGGGPDDHSGQLARPGTARGAQGVGH